MIFFYSKEVVVSLIDKYLDDGKKLGGIVKGNFWKLLKLLYFVFMFVKIFVKIKLICNLVF